MGWLTSARARATRCCWPPDSSQVAPPLVAGEADQLQRLADPARLVRLGRLPLAQPVAHVLRDVHVREQRVVLEHGVHVPAVRRDARDRLAGEVDLALGGLLEARDHPQGRGLAAARRAEERVERAALDRQAHRVDRDDLAEALGDVDDLDVRGSRRGRRGRCAGCRSVSGCATGTAASDRCS